MSNFKKLRYQEFILTSLISVLFVVSCKKPIALITGTGVKIYKGEDSTTYIYEGQLLGGRDLVCTERGEVTPLVKGELEIYNLMKMSGSTEQKSENIRRIAKRQLEFEAAQVRLCHEFGNGSVPYEEYQRRKKEILDIEREWLTRKDELGTERKTTTSEEEGSQEAPQQPQPLPALGYVETESLRIVIES